jgi:predicted PurR-regulated permease PerM
MSEQKKRSRLRDLMQYRTVAAETDTAVPPALQITASYAWRLVVIAAAIAVLIWLVMQLSLLVIPLLLAILLTALVWPVFELMLRARFPRWLAVTLAVIGTIAIVTGLLWLVAWQVTREWPSVQERSIEAFESFQLYLIEGPFHLSPEQITQFFEEMIDLIQEQSQLIWTGAMAIGTTAGQIATGMVLTLFILITLLADGKGIWRWTLKLFPRNARKATNVAATRGWATVINYARTQLLVATIDALGIGLGAFLLGVPLAIPIAVLVFLGSFVPFVGAVITGALAVFLALVYNGPWIALWMLIIVLGVQQFEGQVLQPLLMGSAVKVHPLAIVLVVSGGAMVAGIAGALFAVPLAAFVNVVAVTIASGSWRTGAELDESQLIWTHVPVEPRRRTR